MQDKNHSLRISQTVVDKLTLMAVHAVDDVVDIDGMTVGALIGGVAGGAVGLLQAGPVGSLVGAPMGRCTTRTSFMIMARKSMGWS